VLLRWSIDSDVNCIPKSVTESRIKENIDVFDFKLSNEEMEQIAQLGPTRMRLFLQEWTGVPCFF
jgi:diketogulonate reductase-like aldo/keto reductase